MIACQCLLVILLLATWLHYFRGFNLILGFATKKENSYDSYITELNIQGLSDFLFQNGFVGGKSSKREQISRGKHLSESGYPSSWYTTLFQRSFNIIQMLWTLDGLCCDVSCQLGRG